MAIDGVTLLRVVISERKGVDEAKRIMSLADPVAIGICAAWLNAAVKGAAAEGIGPPLEFFSEYQRVAEAEMKKGF